MQQPPNPSPQYPQWQQAEPLPHQYPQQMPPPQQQTYYAQPQSYYPPPQQPPIQRPKRNRVVLWVIGGIICIILAVLVVVGSVQIGYRFFTSTQYSTLHTEYSGTITEPSFTTSDSAQTAPMVLLITSNDNQGHINGRIGIVLAPNGGDPFSGTLGVDGTITFTATPLLIGSFTVFTGRVNNDGSISGTAKNIFLPQFWKLSPVKGK